MQSSVVFLVLHESWLFSYTCASGRVFFIPPEPQPFAVITFVDLFAINDEDFYPFVFTVKSLHLRYNSLPQHQPLFISLFKLIRQ